MGDEGAPGVPNTAVTTVQGITGGTPLPVAIMSGAGSVSGGAEPAIGVAGTPSVDVLTVQGIAGMTAFKVDGSAATQPVSGTFWQATQPVSAAVLPLPTGAATLAKQPAIGVAGTPSVDVISVQGIAAMTALKTDASATTQPVSATTLPLPTGAATLAKQPALGTAGSAATDVISVQGIAAMTALKIDGSGVTQPVSATSLPLPTGAATLAKQPALGTAGSASVDVISVQGIGSGTALGIGPNGNYTIVASGNFTRPANTTAYASGQLVGNSTTAGSVVPVTLAVGRVSGGTGQIPRARLTKSSTSVTTASFRIHLYTATPTVSNGDGGVWLSNNLATYLGSLDTTIIRAFTTGAKGIAVPTEGTTVPFICVAQNIFALIECRSAYTPISGEVFTIDLDVWQD